jgi:hypothetical protein
MGSGVFYAIRAEMLEQDKLGARVSEELVGELVSSLKTAGIQSL